MADSAGRAAFYPARIAARAWRGRFESAADDVLSAPELARVLDRAFAGSLPEEVARSIVRHRVLERVVRELAESGELERLVEESLASPRTIELTDRLLASAEMQRLLDNVASSPELRSAVARQSAGLAEEVVAGVRRSAVRLDRRLGRRPAAPGYAGVATRGAALAFDSLVALVIFVSGSAAAALIASLVGGLPHWLAGSLLGAAWLIVAGGYFVLFWSAAGQTPGMRLMRLRVIRPGGGGISVGRGMLRAVGLALAIIPLFAGFVPALFDRRRRALADFLATTVVVYDDPHSDERRPTAIDHSPRLVDDVADDRKEARWQLDPSN